MRYIIHKQTLNSYMIGVPQQLMLPYCASVISVGFQGSSLQVWYRFCEGAKDIEAREFIVAFTGHAFELPTALYAAHRGTASWEGLVFHVFEVVPL